MTKPSPVSNLDWNAAYVENWAPWDLGRPQPVWVRLADNGEIASPVLDSGCGTGEHALALAERGLEVVGVDISPAAISRARNKAGERGLEVSFQVGDVLDLPARKFATIIDSGVFHVFDDRDRARYVRSLGGALDPGGVLFVLAFSEHTPGEEGPRRVTQAEFYAAFAHGWSVDRIEPAEFEVREDYQIAPARAWLARMIRG